MEPSKASVVFLSEISPVRIFWFCVLGVTSLIIYDCTLTQREKSAKLELTKSTFEKESINLPNLLRTNIFILLFRYK